MFLLIQFDIFTNNIYFISNMYEFRNFQKHNTYN